jgi:hypothetical protein
MLLTLTDGTAFALGSTRFARSVLPGSTLPRILSEVLVEGVLTRAAVDTGGAYLVCRPDVARKAGLRPASSLGGQIVNIRGRSYSGRLYRQGIEILAQRGDGLRFQGIVFVPELAPGETWGLPSMMGFQGMLEFIRFAIDPVDDTFFFGRVP